MPPAPEPAVAGDTTTNPGVVILNATAGQSLLLNATNSTCSALPCSYTW